MKKWNLRCYLEARLKSSALSIALPLQKFNKTTGFQKTDRFRETAGSEHMPEVRARSFCAADLGLSGSRQVPRAKLEKSKGGLLAEVTLSQLEWPARMIDSRCQIENEHFVLASDGAQGARQVPAVQGYAAHVTRWRKNM